MALLLNIDTATSYGAVALSEDASIIESLENNDQKEHATFLHPAIQQVIKQSGQQLQLLDAIAVTIGPGSYTGLRVALAAAKGLCYALQKPLIAINTLQAMALAAANTYPESVSGKPLLFAPMIDARRMEVFTALYTQHNELYQAPQALILDVYPFVAETDKHEIIFSGDGSQKLSQALPGEHFNISNTFHHINNVAAIATQKFYKNEFEVIAYCEPFYLKPFYMVRNVKF